MPSNIAHGGTLAFDNASGTSELSYNNNGVIFAENALGELGGEITSMSGTGQVIIGSAGTIQLDNAISNNIISFTDNTGVLVIEQLASITSSVQIIGLQTGDVIDIANLPAGFTEAYSQTTGTLTISDAGGNDLGSLFFGGSPLPTSSVVTPAIQATSTPGGGTACYAAGTRIKAGHGDTAVEALAIGDLVRTRAGELVPVKWVGYRYVTCIRHPKPQDVWPVHIHPDAFGDGMPHHDLWLSPDHAVFVDGVLIPIRHLINHATIVQEPRDNVTYWHVELARHDVILAEGLPCETYLDTGNRNAFANGGNVVQMHPDFALCVWEAEGCAPLVVSGPVFNNARQRLNARAAMIGISGAVVGPVRLGGCITGH